MKNPRTFPNLNSENHYDDNYSPGEEYSIFRREHLDDEQEDGFDFENDEEIDDTLDL